MRCARSFCGHAPQPRRMSERYKRRAASRRYSSPRPRASRAVQEAPTMLQVTSFELFTRDQDEALRFYVDALGFEVAEDKRLGTYRWLPVRAPGNKDVAINLELARAPSDVALV